MFPLDFLNIRLDFVNVWSDILHLQEEFIHLASFQGDGNLIPAHVILIALSLLRFARYLFLSHTASVLTALRAANRSLGMLVFVVCCQTERSHWSWKWRPGLFIGELRWTEVGLDRDKEREKASPGADMFVVSWWWWWRCTCCWRLCVPTGLLSVYWLTVLQSHCTVSLSHLPPPSSLLPPPSSRVGGTANLLDNSSDQTGLHILSSQSGEKSFYIVWLERSNNLSRAEQSCHDSVPVSVTSSLSLSEYFSSEHFSHSDQYITSFHLQPHHQTPRQSTLSHRTPDIADFFKTKVNLLFFISKDLHNGIKIKILHNTPVLKNQPIDWDLVSQIFCWFPSLLACQNVSVGANEAE